MTTDYEQTILQKLRHLPPERLAQVEDFVDFLAHRQAAGQLGQQSALDQLCHSIGVVSIIPPEGELSIFEHLQTYLMKPLQGTCLVRYGPF